MKMERTSKSVASKVERDRALLRWRVWCLVSPTNYIFRCELLRVFLRRSSFNIVSGETSDIPCRRDISAWNSAVYRARWPKMARHVERSSCFPRKSMDFPRSYLIFLPPSSVLSNQFKNCKIITRYIRTRYTFR